MGTAFLTGGTGFIGAHVARALLARGQAVRCLVRAQSPLANLEGLDVERRVGDVLDPESLAKAVRGCEVVYHCAADYRLYARDPQELYRHNVDGTRNVLRAAAEAGVGRVVHTSSVGALGLASGGAPATEETPVRLDQVAGHYKRSKLLAEREAMGWADRGLAVVIVNPATPVGELDLKPTPTGKVIVDFLRGRMPAYVHTGLNLVDVRDVAAGHLLAAERGRPGQRYILGHRNLTLKALLDMLAAITGLRAPRVRLPHWVPFLAAAIEAPIAYLRGREPSVPLDGVRMSRATMYFDAGRAVRELGMPQSPIEPALERAVAYFRQRGYVRT